MLKDSRCLRVVGLPSLSLLLVGLATAPARASNTSFNIAFNTSEGPTQGDFNLWLPDDVSIPRGIIFDIPGSSGDSQGRASSAYYQQAARLMGFGFLGCGVHNQTASTLDYLRDPTALQRTLDTAATASGHPELSNAPVAMMGESAGGIRAVYIAKYNPTRVIAVVSQMVSTPPGTTFGDPLGWMSTDSAKIPTLSTPGSLDTVIKPGSVTPFHESWRTNLNAQSAMAVDWGAGHDPTNAQAMDAAFAWISEAVRLRYPAALPSTTPGNPLALKTLNIADGYFADNPKFAADQVTPTYTNPFTPFTPAASYTGDLTKASWLPSLDAAFMYRAMTSVDDPSKVSTRTARPYQGELKFYAIDGQVLGYNSLGHWTDMAVNTNLTVEIDPRAFAKDAGNSIASIQFYDGSNLLSSLSAPNNGSLYQFVYTPNLTGAHALIAIGIDAFGNHTSSFATEFVHGPVSVPEPASMALLAVGLMTLVRRGRRESAR